MLRQGEKRSGEAEGQRGLGSVWIDADSKLMISWIVNDRSQDAANAIIGDLKSRVTRRIQITSDGLSQYQEAVIHAYRPGEADHAEVIKVFANSKPAKDVSPNSAASRYSPGRLLRVEKRAAFGEPNAAHASTSFMERWNLTLLMQNWRFTRLTNGFSKKLENHSYTLAITMVYYNFCRKHRSLKGQTPAMVAGLTEYSGPRVTCSRWTCGRKQHSVLSSFILALMSDENDARTSHLITVKDRVFGPGDHVTIDGHAYVNCFFGACKITYSGGDFGMSNSGTDGSFSLELLDAAARTGTFFQWFKIDIRQYAPTPPYDPIQ